MKLIATASILLIFTIPLTGAGATDSTEFYKKGVLEFKAGRIDKAEKYFAQSLSMNPNYCLANYAMGRIGLTRPLNIKQTIKYFKKSIALDGSFDKGYFYLGMAQMFNGEYANALHSFKKSYELNPATIESLYNMGVLHELLGHEYQSFCHYRLYLQALKKREESPQSPL